MELNRKIRIGLGIIITAGALIAGSSFYLFGLIMIITGVFNLCPACSNGSCEIKSKKIEKQDS